jgi:hypothetical protein
MKFKIKYFFYQNSLLNYSELKYFLLKKLKESKGSGK